MIAFYLKCSSSFPINGTLVDFLEYFGFTYSLHPNTFLFIQNSHPNIILNFIKTRYINFNTKNIIFIQNQNELLSKKFNSFIFSGSNYIENQKFLHSIKSNNKKHCINSAYLNSNIHLFPNIQSDFIFYNESDKKLWLNNLIYNNTPSKNSYINLNHFSLNIANIETLIQNYNNQPLITFYNQTNIKFILTIKKHKVNISFSKNFIPFFFDNFSNYWYIISQNNQPSDYSPRLII